MIAQKYSGVGSNADWLSGVLTGLAIKAGQLKNTINWTIHEDGPYKTYYIHNDPTYLGHTIGLIEVFQGVPLRMLTFVEYKGHVPTNCGACFQKLKGTCLLIKVGSTSATACCESCSKLVYTDHTFSAGVYTDHTFSAGGKFLAYVRLLAEAHEAGRVATGSEGYMDTQQRVVHLGAYVGFTSPDFYEDFCTFVNRADVSPNDNLFLRLKSICGNCEPTFHESQASVIKAGVDLYSSTLHTALLALDVGLEDPSPASHGLGKWYNNNELKEMDTEITGLKSFTVGYSTRYLYFVREKVSGYEFKLFRGTPFNVGTELKIKATIRHKVYKGSWETHLSNPQILSL